MYLKKSYLVIRFFLEFLGGFFMMLRLGGLNLRVVVGKLLVIKLIYSSWIGIKVSGIFRVVVRKIL